MFLQDFNRPDLQFEAAWVLTNIGETGKSRGETWRLSDLCPVASVTKR